MISTIAPPNSSAPTTAQLVGGVYNQAAPVLNSGQGTFLQVDVNGKLLVNDGGGGGGLSDVNITEIAGNPVGLTNPLAVELSDGTNPFGTVGNPIHVTGGGSGDTQYTDLTAETAGAFIGTVALGYNGTDVVGLRLDASNNLNVNLKTAIPTGGNLIGQVEVSDGTNILFTSAHPGITTGSLQHNHAAPASNNLGVLSAIANASAPIFSEGDQVLLSTDLSGNLRVNVTAVVAESVTQGTVPWVDDITQWANVALGAPTAFGLAPSGNVVGVNAEMFQGVTAVGSGNPLQVSLANTGSNATAVNVAQATAASLNATIVGTLTNNNAAPSNNNIGVLSSRANASAPTWTEGDQVLASVDLSGNQRVVLNAETTKVIGTVNQGTSPWVDNITQWNTTALGSPTAFGSAPSGNVIGVNADVLAAATYMSGTVPGVAPSSTEVVGGIYNSSAPAPTTGQTLPLQLDAAGNAKTFPGLVTQTLPVWNSSNWTGGFSAVLASNIGSPAVVVTLDQTGTFSTGAVRFQGTFDGINWVTIGTNQIFDPSNAVPFTNINPTYSFVSSANQPFLIFMGGYQQIRAFEIQAITGNGVVTPHVTQIPYLPYSFVNFSSGAILLTNDTSDMSGQAPGGPPSTTLITGGVYNTTLPVPTNGQTLAFQQDASGNLKVSVSALTDPAEGIPGQVAPADAIQIGGVDDSGLLRAASVNALGQQRIDGSLFFEAYTAMIQELRSIRLILTSLATQDGSASPNDFNPQGWDDDYNSVITIN